MSRFVVEFKAEKCKGCELCRTVCPKGLISMSATVNSKGYCPAEITAQEECIGCTSCALICPDGAIAIYAQEEGRAQ